MYYLYLFHYLEYLILSTLFIYKYCFFFSSPKCNFGLLSSRYCMYILYFLHAKHYGYCQSSVKFHISFYVKIVPWENMFTWRKCGRPWRHELVMKWLFKNDQHICVHMKPFCLELQIKNSHLNIFSDVFVHIPECCAAKPQNWCMSWSRLYCTL